jgi:hypothetical protein
MVNNTFLIVVCFILWSYQINVSFILDDLDDYDHEFLKMKEESERNKFGRMMEELEKYKNTVEECKKNLAEKRKQVS